MNNINYLEIENFKSIKHLRFDCKRVNLFIGKPNVGKSNILEALGLYCAYYEVNEEKYLSSFIRYNQIKNLYYDQKINNDIFVSSDFGISTLKYRVHSPEEFAHFIINASKDEIDNKIDEFSVSSLRDSFNSFLRNPDISFKGRTKSLLELISKPQILPLFNSFNISGKLDNSSTINKQFFRNTPFKKYDFLKSNIYNNPFSKYLYPPFGNNLFAIVAENKNLSKEIRSFFEEYGLQLILKVNESEFEILKNIDGIGYSYPYISVADTLQRIIFYLAAIESNKDSVLVFEEPEAHAYPPYTSLLAERISNDKDNQYFITTHSPYLLNTIISNTPSEDLCVYLTYYENYETKVKLLPHDKLREMLDEGFDVFSQFRYLMDEYALGN